MAGRAALLRVTLLKHHQSFLVYETVYVYSAEKIGGKFLLMLNIWIISYSNEHTYKIVLGMTVLRISDHVLRLETTSSSYTEKG